MSVRSTASLLSQIKCIEQGGLLTELEKDQIERQITVERISGGDKRRNENEIDRNSGKTVEDVLGEGEEVDFAIVNGTLITQECIVKVEKLDSFAGRNGSMVDEEVKTQECIVQAEKLNSFAGRGGLRCVSDEEEQILCRIHEVFLNDETVDIPSLKGRDRRKVMEQVNMVNSLLHNLFNECRDVTAVNRLIYAGSYVVCERLGLLNKAKYAKSKKPWWQRRLEEKVEQWRKDISRVERIQEGVKLKTKTMLELERRYSLTKAGTQSVLSLIKRKLQSASTKIKWHLEANLRTRQNTLFKNNQSYLYKELGGSTASKSEGPDGEEARTFWGNIWSNEVDFNREATWLPGIKEGFSSVRPQEDIETTIDDMRDGVKKMDNWKAPGPDGVQGFWFKKFSSLLPKLADSLSSCLRASEVPQWLVKSRTVLIQKDPKKGTAASNYRPIACLPLMWKLLSGIFASKIYDHLHSNGLLPDEQKGCRKGTRGTKDQLLIDKAVLKEAKRKHRCLSMAWIDYRKAYDMIPHTWILEMLDTTKVAGNIGRLVKESMRHWTTELTSNGQSLGEVKINRGSFRETLCHLCFSFFL
ncbi:MAG: reverse transcriptase domain-containing protein [Bacteroidota bacterium]